MQGDSSMIEVLDALATPVLQVAGDGRIRQANEAAGRWLRVGRKRLIGLPLAALERDGQAVMNALAQTDGSQHLLRRVQLAFPGSHESLFADLWLSPVADGVWCEAHPVDEFPGADPSELLPFALSASLKGLAHELRNPLAGIKGAAQLLARRSDPDALELTELIESEVERLAGLVNRLAALDAVFGARPLMARTRMQAALPVTVADRLAVWRLPLEGHLDRLNRLRPEVERIQFREVAATALRGYRVFLPAAGSREQALKTARDLSARGVTDYYVVTAGEQQNTVSLGIFRDLANARARHDEIAAMGYDATIEARTEQTPQWWVEIAAETGFDWQPLLPDAGLQANSAECF